MIADVEENMKRPNVLLICADMASAKHFGCYGDPAQVTPNVDALAERGVRFTRAYCASTPCIPARICMMTGQYAHTSGKMAHIKMELLPRPPLLAEILRQNGYRTALVGKTHFWPPADPLGCEIAQITIDNHLTPELGEQDAYLQFLKARGLYDYHDETWEQDRHLLHADNLPADCLKVNWTGDTACALLDDLAGGEDPFFLFCSFVEPHGPGSVQTEFLQQFDDLPLRPIIGREGEHDTKPDVQRRAVARWNEQLAGQDLDHRRRGVYASIHLVDRNIGKVLAKLGVLGVRDDTIVLFTTDHGDLLFDHACIEQTFLYESAIHIPWIVAGPGIPAQEDRSHLVSQVDLLPTVLDLCGIEEGEGTVEGRSLRPILEDPSRPWRETLFCEVEQSVHLRDLVSSCSAKMLRTGPWKYVYTLVDGHTAEHELYNLDVDPDELYNLAHDPAQAERMAAYRDEILRWLVATEVNRLRPVPENHYPVPRNKTTDDRRQTTSDSRDVA